MKSHQSRKKPIVFLVLISILIICATISIFNPAIADDDDDNDDDRHYSVIHIAEDGHYQSDYYYIYSADSLEIEVIVIEGGKIDVYLMTDTQYRHAYPFWTNNPPKSISYLDISEEDVNYFHITYDVPDVDDDLDSSELCVVIDNRNCNLTPEDATPEGVVSVKLYINEEYTDDFTFVDQFPDFGAICLLGFIILVIIIIIVFFFIYLIFKNPKRPPALHHVPSRATYPYYYYPYYHYPGNYDKGTPPEQRTKRKKSKKPSTNK